jgi:lipid-binding SYLF domain-containing protein
VGSVGRAAEAGILPVAAVCTYSRSQGLFAGASLEGTILIAQSDKNARYYGGLGDSRADPKWPHRQVQGS